MSNQQKNKQQKPRGQQENLVQIDEAPYAQNLEVEEGEQVTTVDQNGQEKIGTVTTKENGDVEIIAADGEVLASSEEIVELPDNKVAQLVVDYVALMGPNTAPTVEQQKRGIQILEVIVNRAFGEHGIDEARDCLVPVLEEARKHPETFRSERLVRGMAGAFGHNVARQRQMQAYINILANVVEKGNKARFSASTLTALMGETKANAVRVVLKEVLKLNLV